MADSLRRPWEAHSARRLGWLLVFLALTASAAGARSAESTSGAPGAGFLYDDLFALAIPAPGRVFVVGAWGRLLQSSDGGRSWGGSYLASPTALLGIAFADADTGWIVGERGLVLATRDGGRSWAPQPTPSSLHLFAVAALDPARVWAVGEQGTLLRSEDGGRSWLDESIGEDLILNDIHFVDEHRCWIVGEFGTLLRSEDAGRTWSRHGVIRGAPEDLYLFGVGFSDGNGLAVGLGGTLLSTHDGGVQWTALESGTTNHLFAIAPAGAGAVAVGDQAVIRRFDAGGELAEVSAPEASLWLRDVAFLGDEGYAVGAKAQILRSTDAGRSWSNVSLGRSASPEPGEGPE